MLLGMPCGLVMSMGKLGHLEGILTWLGSGLHDIKSCYGIIKRQNAAFTKHSQLAQRLMLQSAPEQFALPRVPSSSASGVLVPADSKRKRVGSPLTRSQMEIEFLLQEHHDCVCMESSMQSAAQ